MPPARCGLAIPSTALSPLLTPKTGAVKGRLVLDERQRSETVRPLQPRELAVNEQTNTVYITGLGKESVIWVVDGATLKLKTTITGTGGNGDGSGDRSAG
ncbi:putative receptor [Klebsiella pneumoniae]|nr:putative receptor [Klebsiella pneumoniae]